MADLPPPAALAEALADAAAAHDDYETTLLKGIVDDRWSGFCAAFVIGRLGEFTPAGRLAALLEEVDASGDWAEAAAGHVLTKLRS
jgi:hypothetical protein